MSKFIQANLNNLNKLKEQTTRDANKITKKRIEHIIKLYKSRDIRNIATAENLIKGLISKNKKIYDKALKRYKEILEELKNKNMNTYLVNFQCYNIRDPKKMKIKPAFIKGGRYYYIENFDIRQATVKAKEFNNAWIKRIIFRHFYRGDEGFDELIEKYKDFHILDHTTLGEVPNPEFDELIKIMSTDKDFKELMEHLSAYVFDAIKIQGVEMVKKKGKKIDITKQDLTDATENVSIYHRYILTEVNARMGYLKGAMEKTEHTKNQCWKNALVDFYSDTLMDDRRRKRLSVDRIIEITGRDDFYSKGASISDMDKVFREFNIPARIYDQFLNPIYRHDPEKSSFHIKPFFALVKNSHIYTFNEDIKSLEQTGGKERKTGIVKATTDYHLNEKDEPPEYRMFRHTDDLLKLIEPVKPKSKEIVTKYVVPERNNLTEIFVEMVGAGYEPSITLQAGIVTQIKVRFNRTRFIIKSQNLIRDTADGNITVDDEETYNNINRAMFDFNKGLFNPLHKSYYNQEDFDIYEQTKTIVASGTFYRDEDIPKNIVEADISKAFTGSLIDISEVPVFNQFDKWKVYKDVDYNELSDYTLYFIRAGWDTKIMFNKRFNLVYGKYLKQLNTRGIEILYYKVPSFIHRVSYKELIEELWSKNISSDDHLDKLIKKLIANVNIGLLERTCSKDQKSVVFKNLSEACEFKATHGGKIHKLTDYETIDDIEEERDSYYITNISDIAKLKNGFIYIKELLLQGHNFKMYRDYHKLIEKGIQVYSVKTDAFTIDQENEEKAREILKTEQGGIGKWRISKEEGVILPSVLYQQQPIEAKEITTPENIELKIEDEYNMQDIIGKIIQAKQVMIRAKYAGSGKSYICERMGEIGMNVLFVCPTNKLVQKYGKEAVTVNKFFGISIGEERLEAMDYSKYDAVVFDEIYFNGLGVLNRIREFVEKNPDLIIIGTGDGKQLKPVNELTNTQKHEVYMNSCINQIFKYGIYLKECKRLKTKEDKEKLSNIYDDIFINNVKPKELMERYFKYTKVISLNKNNIAYLNDTCKEVSKEIRKTENRTAEYEVGEVMICREYLKTTRYKFNVNFRYVIQNINAETVVLCNEVDRISQEVPIVILRKHFIFAYCYTCHSVQGSSIDDAIKIFNYNHWLVSKEWLYTAITRSTDLNKVYFYKYSSDVKEDVFNKNCVYNYMCRKVKGYKEQDHAGKRKVEHKHFITADWLMERLNGCCVKCGIEFHLKMVKGNIQTNLTAQRINNNICHTIENCVAYCKNCNCAASNKEKF